MTDDYLQVFTTVERREDTEVIARILLESRLAACVQVVGPIKSTYWWKGSVETAEEWLCIIKSKKNLYSQLEAAIRKAHTYEIPEITAFPIVAGSKTYLRWLDTVLNE